MLKGFDGWKFLAVLGIFLFGMFMMEESVALMGAVPSGTLTLLKLFCKGLESDISDIQGGTTHEGIHLGAMAGTVDILQRCYTGLQFHDDIFILNPRIPEDLPELRMRIKYRGR